MSQERILLEETFYVLTKKNSVFRVRLTTGGLSLIKESQSHVKEQTIPTKDIVGCRCLRSKKPTTSCSCQSLPRAGGGLKVVDENSPEQDETDASTYLYVYAYVLQNKQNGNSKREKTIITLRFRSFDKYEENHKEAQRWRTAIKQLIRGDNQTEPNADVSIMSRINEQRKLLVICNPKSGPGKGKSIFEEKVAPVLEEAEIQFEFHLTTHANHAREFIRTCNVFQWNGVVLVCIF
nr:sphingosine kinase 2-like [Onthophagus taurus]